MPGVEVTPGGLVGVFDVEVGAVVRVGVSDAVVGVSYGVPDTADRVRRREGLDRCRRAHRSSSSSRCAGNPEPYIVEPQ